MYLPDKIVSTNFIYLLEIEHCLTSALPVLIVQFDSPHGLSLLCMAAALPT